MRQASLALALALAVVPGCGPDLSPTAGAPDWVRAQNLPGLPGDCYETCPITGKPYNASLMRRQADRADELLARLRPTLKTRSVPELIEMLAFVDHINYGNGVEYFVARDGNGLIMDEIVRRGEDARAVLERYTTEPYHQSREIFTGGNGRPLTLQTFARETIEVVERRAARSKAESALPHPTDERSRPVQ